MSEKGLKYISFGGLTATIVLLIAATIIEKLEGSSFALTYVYHSPAFIVLLGITATSALLYIARARAIRLFLLHCSLAIILCGALISFLTAGHGEMILAKDAVPASMFVENSCKLEKFPFRMRLIETATLYDREGMPTDHIAKIEIQDKEEEAVFTLSMNNPIKKDGYTFCIKSHSPDAVSLLVAHDPLGRIVTYTGYTLFIIFFTLTMLSRKSLFCALQHKEEDNGNHAATPIGKVLYTASVILFIAIGIAGAIRWYRIGLFPVTNGHEAMVFIAWCSLLAGVVCGKKKSFFLPTMFTLSATTLAAALFTRENSAAHVLPILRTPLLGIHVTCVILSYTITGFLAINALIAIFHSDARRVAQLANTGRRLLYPATILLFAGIFIGSVWAEISWGRYWGWDPKEVWALITLLSCSLPLHTRSIPQLARPIVFHYFCLVLFLAMLFTYLGVNYFLGGMHAYL